MNNYKELLKELRKLQNLGDAPIGREFAVIVDKLTLPTNPKIALALAWGLDRMIKNHSGVKEDIHDG